MTNGFMPEASGNVRFEDLDDWMTAGVDVLSTSSMNMGVRSIDISMLVDESGVRHFPRKADGALHIPTTMGEAESHPRYASLMSRQRLVDAMKEGLLAGSALIAHGRRSFRLSNWGTNRAWRGCSYR